MRVCFDMDGTFVNLYGVENWLAYLQNENPFPYLAAKPLVNLSRLARYMNRLQEKGIEICIISWLSKNGTAEYNQTVTDAKRIWLEKHLPSVNFNEIIIVPYGTPKSNFKFENDILFDDELPNRKAWGENAYRQDEIFEVLKNLMAA